MVPLIRELLTDEEYAELLRRMVLPNGPLLDYKQAFGEQELRAPNAARTLGASCIVLKREAPSDPLLCHKRPNHRCQNHLAIPGRRDVQERGSWVE